MPSFTTNLTVRVPAATLDRLRERAEYNDRTMAQEVRRAIQLYLNQPPETPLGVAREQAVRDSLLAQLVG